MPADRILAGKTELSGGLADEGDVSARQPLAGGKDTTVHQRNLYCRKISRLRAAHHQVEALALRQRRLLDDAHDIVAAPALPRSRAHQPRRLHSGQRADALNEALKEGDLLD